MFYMSCDPHYSQVLGASHPLVIIGSLHQLPDTWPLYENESILLISSFWLLGLICSVFTTQDMIVPSLSVSLTNEIMKKLMIPLWLLRVTRRQEAGDMWLRRLGWWRGEEVMTGFPIISYLHRVSVTHGTRQLIYPRWEAFKLRSASSDAGLLKSSINCVATKSFWSRPQVVTGSEGCNYDVCWTRF